MAKKNSTKTATKEAIQNSEPRMMTFKGWKGININESPLGWNPIEAGEFNESDLMPNYLVVQNNANTTHSGSIETRNDTVILAEPPVENGKQLEFTGVSCLRSDKLICAFNDNSIRWIQLGTSEWNKINIIDVVDGRIDQAVRWTSIEYYQSTLICLTGPAKNDRISGEIFVGDFDPITDEMPEFVKNAKEIPNPTIKPKLERMGSLEDGTVSRISIGYVYSNKFGTTMSDGTWESISVAEGPERWHSGKYLTIYTEGNAIPQGYDITGVDLYCRLDENSDSIFIGHVDIKEDQTNWMFNWLGAMADTSAWTSVSLQLPTENTTKGVDASYVRVHDGRLYFWGGKDKYRLWIGGNPGNELSVARGTGGAFVDIEPGSGIEIKGTAKFKTYNGASIVTIMCSNHNSSKVKRYNLVETNLTISNELSTKGYMAEEVANVVGCTSSHGFGAWADGLYSIYRYGLMVTTMAMEYNSQLRSSPVSENIAPIFNDIKAERLANSHMIYIDDKLYIIMGEEENYDTDNDNLYERLDRLILCYDINSKCWWTYTFDIDEEVISVTNIDAENHWEGLGIITPSKFCLIPTTGPTASSSPTWNPNSIWEPKNDKDLAFEVTVETGELTIRTPPQNTSYLSQLEFRFDYIVGDMEIIVDGVDYYGRRRTIKKEVSIDEIQRRYAVYMRVDELFETYKVTIKGKVRFRMTHFIAKLYTQSSRIDQVYGFVDHSYYSDRHGGSTDVHHPLDSYNNLRDAIIP